MKSTLPRVARRGERPAAFRGRCATERRSLFADDLGTTRAKPASKSLVANSNRLPGTGCASAALCRPQLSPPERRRRAPTSRVCRYSLSMPIESRGPGPCPRRPEKSLRLQCVRGPLPPPLVSPVCRVLPRSGSTVRARGVARAFVRRRLAAQSHEALQWSKREVLLQTLDDAARLALAPGSQNRFQQFVAALEVPVKAATANTEACGHLARDGGASPVEAIQRRLDRELDTLTIRRSTVERVFGWMCAGPVHCRAETIQVLRQRLDPLAFDPQHPPLAITRQGCSRLLCPTDLQRCSRYSPNDIDQPIASSCKV